MSEPFGHNQWRLQVLPGRDYADAWVAINILIPHREARHLAANYSCSLIRSDGSSNYSRTGSKPSNVREYSNGFTNFIRR